MNRADYESVDAENFSNLKRILDSPANYKYGKPDKEDPAQYAVGKLAHALVLENKDLRHLYVRKPDGMSFASKEGMEWKAAQTLPILTAEEWDLIPAMGEAIANDKHASALIRMCPKREYFLSGKIQSIEFKGIADLIGMDQNSASMHVDMKTCRDASPFGFEKAVRDLHYDLQDEIYTQLIALDAELEYRPKSAWVCVEDSKPYEVACYFPSMDMIECGIMKLQACIDRLKSCRENDQWPKSLSGLHELAPSKYALESARKMVSTSY